MVETYNICGKEFKVIDGAFVIGGADCCKQVINGYMLCTQKQESVSVYDLILQNCKYTFNYPEQMDNNEITDDDDGYDGDIDDKNKIYINNLDYDDELDIEFNNDEDVVCVIENTNTDGIDIENDTDGIENAYFKFDNCNLTSEFDIEFDDVNLNNFLIKADKIYVDDELNFRLDCDIAKYCCILSEIKLSDDFGIDLNTADTANISLQSVSCNDFEIDLNTADNANISLNNVSSDGDDFEIDLKEVKDTANISLNNVSGDDFYLTFNNAAINKLNIECEELNISDDFDVDINYSNIDEISMSFKNLYFYDAFDIDFHQSNISSVDISVDGFNGIGDDYYGFGISFQESEIDNINVKAQNLIGAESLWIHGAKKSQKAYFYIQGDENIDDIYINFSNCNIDDLTLIFDNIDFENNTWDFACDFSGFTGNKLTIKGVSQSEKEHIQKQLQDTDIELDIQTS